MRASFISTSNRPSLSCIRMESGKDEIQKLDDHERDGAAERGPE
jgi:hypothetical protein